MEESHALGEAVETPFGVFIGAREPKCVRFSRVRYAMPPVGHRRFCLPEPIAPSDEPIDCRGQGVVPPQLPSRLARVMGVYPAIQDEDCLHLDIWVPADRSPETPVLVFMHGGAFMTGGGSLACYAGGELAVNSGLIVVNVSYRLGALGYLAIEEVAPPNLGFLDQVAAMRWIGRAISSFGGDPENITIAGQSAGAYSIAMMLASPSCGGLFKRALMMSAPLGIDLPTEDKQNVIGATFMDLLGLSHIDRAGAQALPIDVLLAAQQQLLRSLGGAPGDVSPPFVPAIDGEMVRAGMREVIPQCASVCDLLIGTTREEMAAFYYGDDRLADLSEDAVAEAFRRHYGDAGVEMMWRNRARRVPGTPIALLTDLMGETTFVQPNLELAKARTAAGGTSFVYQFDWQSPTPGIQACHCIELPFLFGNFDVWSTAPMMAGAEIREITDLSRAFQRALGSFARSGAPDGPEGLAWPPYGARRIIQHFDRSISAVSTDA